MDENQVEVVEAENNTQDSSSELNLRGALKKELNRSEEKQTQEPVVEASQEADTAREEVVAQPETPQTVYAPPSDMNKAEKDAFLNPTAENAHILQNYLNRRAYETRTQYDKKAQELNQLIERNSGVYNVLKDYQDEYAKEGLQIEQVARRSVLWDRAMRNNPLDTAREWLESYGLSPEDLVNQVPAQEQQQPVNYLTKEEAERIAEEKWKALHSEQEKKAVEYMNQKIVESFVSQKPLFRDPETASQLEAEMAPVVQALATTGRYSSQEEILETAYNYVVNGNPVFASLAQKLIAKPQLVQQAQVAQKAKQAAKSISGSAGSGTPRVITNDIRDNLRRRMSGE